VGFEKIATEIFTYITHLSGAPAYGTIVGVLLICGLGVPIPEDITLLAAGLLASAGSITLPGAFLAGLGGVLGGDAFLFFLGRRFGKKVFQLPGLRKVFIPERLIAAEERIRRFGPLICFIARFLPGLRAAVFAMSGALGVKPYVFFSLDGLAALLSVPLWIMLGYWFGENFDEAIRRAKHLEGLILAVLILGISFLITWKLWQRRRNQNAAE
jgi:membrane protein DedA with SNARE-associated domain